MKIIGFIIAAIVLLGTFLYFSAETGEGTCTSSGNKVTVIPSQTAVSEKAISLVVRNNEIASGNEIINLNEDDTVILTISSDVNEELHIHGYDTSVQLKSDIPVQLTFTASMSGRFPYELEESGTELGAIQVQPK